MPATPVPFRTFSLALALLSGLLAEAPAQSVTPYGCGVNPPGTLTVTKGTGPTINSTIQFEIDNPSKTTGCGTFTALMVHALPDPAHPCGTRIPSWGMAKVGAPGEFLLAPGFLMVNGPTWGCTPGPANVRVPIPAEVGLIGTRVYTQGLMFDPASPIGFALTNGLELQVGPSPRRLAFGQSVVSTISPVGEYEAYAFDARAGDELVIPYVDTTGYGFSVRFELYDAGWQPLGSSEGRGTEFRPAPLPATGTFHLVVRTRSGRTGNFQFTLQRTRDPGNVTATGFGSSFPRSIGAANTEIDVYRFTAAAGDELYVPYVDVTGYGFAVRLALHDSTGRRLAETTNTGSGVFQTSIPATGTYDLWVYNPSRSRTGNYHFTLQRTRNPGAVVARTIGDGIVTSIGAANTEIDVYRFDANQADRMFIPYVETTGYGFAVRLALYDASGKRIAETVATHSGVFAPVVPATGTYHLWVYNPSRSRTGNYQVTLQRANDPQPRMRILPGGAAVQGAISPITEVDVYEFGALPAQQRTCVFVDRTGYGFALEVTLRDSTGKVLGTSTSGTLPIAVPALGTYQLWVRNPRLSRTGNYSIQVK